MERVKARVALLRLRYVTLSCNTMREPMNYDLFISVPMSALPIEQAEPFLQEVHALVRALRTDAQLRVYFAGEHSAKGGAGAPAVAAQHDLDALESSRVLILLYPGPVPSSALIELGYALGTGKDCWIFAGRTKDLPFLARELDEVRLPRGGLVHIESFVDVPSLATRLCNERAFRYRPQPGRTGSSGTRHQRRASDQGDIRTRRA